MAWFTRSERGIGRGEVAESRLEVPFFAAFMVGCAIALFVFHFYLGNQNLTIAMAVSMVVFGTTIIRVDYGIYILVTAMLLSPEIEAGTVGPHAERGLNLRYDDILIIVVFLGILVKLAFEGRPMLFRPNPVNGGIFAYYLVCIISTLDALRISVPAWDRTVAFFVMLKMLEYYMIFVMVGLAVNTLPDIRRQLTVFLTVGLVVCAYGIVSIGTLDRVSAPFEAGGTEPNTLGGYLLIVMCLAGGLFACAPSRGWKLLYTLIVLAAFLPFIMTLSRASYVSLLAAFTALGILGRRLSIVLTVVAVVALSPLIMPQDVKDRVNYTFQRGAGKPVINMGGDRTLQVDKSTYERIYVWKKVRFNLSVWPWFGGGVSWENVLDSQFARVLIETGVMGFAAFLFLLYRMLRSSRQAYRWSRDWVARGLSLGVMAMTVGLIVHGLGTITFLIVRIMEPFWFLLALTIVARDIALSDHARTLQARREEAARQEDPALPQGLPTPSRAST